MDEGISIVIPTLNGGKIFSECLEAIAGQDYGGTVQLIVIDSGSVDGTDSLAEKAGAVVKRIDRKKFHHARTRNDAISLTRFNKVIFLVQDAIPCTGKWLSEMAGALDKNKAAAFAAQVPHVNASSYARFEIEAISQARLATPFVEGVDSFESFQKMPYDKAYRCVGLDNVCAIYRKELLEKTPFPDVEFAEDLAWAVKISMLGHRISYLPHIQVRHSHDRSPDYGFRRQITNSYWVARIMGRVREDVSYLSLRELMCITGAVRTLVLEKIKEQWDGIEGFQKNALFFDRLWKRYPHLCRIRMWRGQRTLCPEAQKIVHQANADIIYRLKLIVDGYPPRNRKEWRRVLEQISANILGRIHGEVYASCTLKGPTPRQLKKFIKPFLSGV